MVADDRLISRLPLAPARQLIGAQCSGALVLARLGLLDGMPACADKKSRPLVEARDVLDCVAPVGEHRETVERALRAAHAGEVALGR